MTVKSKPDGYHTVTPYLLVDDIDKLIAFLERVFDATVGERMIKDDGTAYHAEVQIGDSKVMMGNPGDDKQTMPCMLYLYVDDVDATYARAVEAGAESVREPTDEFYGDRSGGVKGPCGNQWWIATHKEDLSPEELKARAATARG